MCQYDSWARMLRPYGIARGMASPRRRHRTIARWMASHGVWHRHDAVIARWTASHDRTVDGIATTPGIAPSNAIAIAASHRPHDGRHRTPLPLGAARLGDVARYGGVERPAGPSLRGYHCRAVWRMPNAITCRHGVAYRPRRLRRRTCWTGIPGVWYAVTWCGGIPFAKRHDWADIAR
jgi:hypothetical protein